MSSVKTLVSRMLPSKLNRSINSALKAFRAFPSAGASQLIAMDAGTGEVLCSCLNDIHDRQRRRRPQHSRDTNQAAPTAPDQCFELHGYADKGGGPSSLDRKKGSDPSRSGTAPISSRGLVFLYVPSTAASLSVFSSTTRISGEEESNNRTYNEDDQVRSDNNYRNRIGHYLSLIHI